MHTKLFIFKTKTLVENMICNKCFINRIKLSKFSHTKEKINFFNFKMARELPIRKEYFNVEQFENFIEHEYKQKYSVLENIVTFWKLRKKMNNKNY